MEKKVIVDLDIPTIDTLSNWYQLPSSERLDLYEQLEWLTEEDRRLPAQAQR